MENVIFTAKCDDCKWKMCIEADSYEGEVVARDTIQDLSRNHEYVFGHTVQIIKNGCRREA
jgi:hypothetical protein